LPIADCQLAVSIELLADHSGSSQSANRQLAIADLQCPKHVIADCQLPIANWLFRLNYWPIIAVVSKRQSAIGNRRSAMS
jgi:hypothetical protein